MTMFVSPFRVPATNAPLKLAVSLMSRPIVSPIQNFIPEPNEDGIEIDASYAMEEDFSVSVFNERYRGTSLALLIIPNASLPSIKAVGPRRRWRRHATAHQRCLPSEFQRRSVEGKFPGLPEDLRKR